MRFKRVLKDLKLIGYSLLGRPYNNNPLRSGPYKNFVFIHINKTAGRSVGKALGIEKKQHLTVREVVDIIGSEKWYQAFTFTFVRNPWDRVVSLYKYRIKTGEVDADTSFREWIFSTFDKNKWKGHYDKRAFKMIMPQVEWIKNNRGEIDINFIGYYERLNKDFGFVSDKIGLNVKLPHANSSSKGANYKDYYDEETVDIISDWFNEDIYLFNYSF